jgi:siderophore synthetase component
MNHSHDPRVTAEHAAVRRLLNSYLRETGIDDPRATPEDPTAQVKLPCSGTILVGRLVYWSALGHHVYAADWAGQLSPDQAPVPLEHADLVDLLLDELAALSPNDVNPADGQRRRAELAAQIDNSVERTAQYLAHGRSARPSDGEHWALTRYAEQSVLLGHPLHPTPKSAEGFSDLDLAAYAPELGASFALHYVAVAPELVAQRRVAPGSWLPAAVCAEARQQLEPSYHDYALLPVHPWQAKYLLRHEPIQRLIATRAVIPLGALGPRVYPTSSVRTVCDPAFGTAWKLPLHVRITNLVRNNPPEHARRAADASSLITTLRDGWPRSFTVLVETGYRTLDHPELAAELCVLYRENPFAHHAEAPQVLAGLLEEQPDGGEPDLLRYVRQATEAPDGALCARRATDWLNSYLAVSLRPLLEIFSGYGISLEAHVQNSLLRLEDGWPTGFCVRDMEGASASRERVADVLEPDSPVLYEDAEAWMRWQYHVITNHLGHLVHVLGRYGQVDERRLWTVVAGSLREALPDPYAARLLAADVLPAKANLHSRFAERGERPLHVTVPNPIREVNL